MVSLHNNPTEASPAHPVGVYGKRKAMYDSVSKMTFRLKYDTSRQKKFQIYREEEYTEVNDRKILRAVIIIIEESRLAILPIMK